MTYTWYIEPLNDFTNEYLSRELPAENALRDKLCSDGKQRNLWQCSDYRFVTYVKKSNVPLKYKVFVKEGNGKIRECNLPAKRDRLKKAQKGFRHGKPSIL